MFLPSPYFIVFELLILALFCLCLRDAWFKGPGVIWQLIAGVSFGLLLEWATIQQLNAYQYGHFMLMLGPVPLTIGIAWGTIIYSVRTFSDATDLPLFARPALDSLLALNIDLSMDAIAIRLGMWDWGKGFDYQYFGVPFNNFWAWFWVVFSFSLSLRLLGKLPGKWGLWLAPPGAVALGTAGVLATNRLITSIPNDNLHWATIAFVLGGAIVMLVLLRPAVSASALLSMGSFVFLVPLGIHSYFLTAGLLSGVILHPPFLLSVSMVMGLAALYLHRSALKNWVSSNF